MMRKNHRIKYTAVVMALVVTMTFELPLTVLATQPGGAADMVADEENIENTVSFDDISEESVSEVPETEPEEAKLPSGGLMQMEIMDVGEVDDAVIFDAGESETEPQSGISTYGLEQADALYGSAIYNSEWDKYSTNFFYNQMDDAHKAVWDNLDALCLEYLVGDREITRSYTNDKNQTTDITDYVVYNCDFTGMSATQIKEDIESFGWIFRISNPQYYFLKSSVLYGTSSTSVSTSLIISIGVYPSFVDVKARDAATASVKAKADAWIDLADACSSDAEKLKVLHDEVAKKVKYDNDVIADGKIDFTEENTYFTQSAYSVFCTDKTVCAGYSQALEMVLNGAGVDSIAVTSEGHEWNKVRIDDNWYNVDCTWDDQESGIQYYYYGRSDAVYDSDSSLVNRSNHTEKSFWNPYLPDCVLDTKSTYSAPGAFSAISERTPAPGVTVTPIPELGMYQVTMTGTGSGVKMYYTLDGSIPACARSKSILYKGPFYIDGGLVLTTIAVSNGKLDSEPVTGERMPIVEIPPAEPPAPAPDPAPTPEVPVSQPVVSTLPQYAIIYNLKGGTNNSENPATYDKSKTVTFKKPTKTGYKFAGWYTDSKYNNKITKIKKGSKGKIKIYAKWTANQYTVVFKANGGKGTMEKMSCTYDKKYKLRSNTFTRKKYKFVGWNTAKDGTGISYKNKKQIKNLTAKSNGKVTLYAQWKKK